MEDRTALLLAWLEEEGERQRRPILPPPAINDLNPPGWVHVGVCALGGVLALALFVCWLVTAWEISNRCALIESLRQFGFRRAIGDPNPLMEEQVTSTANGDALLFMGKIIGIALGTVIGSVFLCVACSFHNKLVGAKGSPTGVPEPLFHQAMGIMFIPTLLNAVAGIHLLSSLASLLVMVGLTSALLPTTLSRGLLVALCYLLVGIVAVVVVAVIIGALLLLLATVRYGMAALIWYVG